MNGVVERVVSWLRASYPTGVPEQDYQPLFALMRRRLTDAEVQELGQSLVLEGLVPADRIDVGVGVTKVTQELPSPQELTRVTRHLEAYGFPVDGDIRSDPRS